MKNAYGVLALFNRLIVYADYFDLSVKQWIIFSNSVNKQRLEKPIIYIMLSRLTRQHSTGMKKKNTALLV